MKRIGVFVLGVFLIVVGMAGLVLPILPGWVMIFLGLSLIAPEFAARLRRRIFGKFLKKEIFFIGEWKKSGVEAGFTTRHFPLVLRKTDELLDEEKQRQFASFLNHSHGKFVFLNQVHGDTVAVVQDKAQFSKEGFYCIPESDAAITNIPGLSVLVFTADCLPIFFNAGEWVGLVHAGWRGTHKKISQKTLRLISEKSGIPAKDIKIYFGPAICVKSYEVGEEFKNYFPESSFELKKGRLFFNLLKENQRQLVESGAHMRNIINYGFCTFEEEESFYSFRREKEAAGRMISFISKS